MSLSGIKKIFLNGTGMGFGILIAQNNIILPRFKPNVLSQINAETSKLLRSICLVLVSHGLRKRSTKCLPQRTFYFLTRKTTPHCQYCLSAKCKKHTSQPTSLCERRKYLDTKRTAMQRQSRGN